MALHDCQRSTPRDVELRKEKSASQPAERMDCDVFIGGKEFGNRIRRADLYQAEDEHALERCEILIFATDGNKNEFCLSEFLYNTG